MGKTIDVEIEMVRSKDDPSQLWIREVTKKGSKYKNDWQVDFIHQDYQYLMDENRIDEIPDYAVEGRSIVSSEGTVKQAYTENLNFDEAKIASCELRRISTVEVDAPKPN